MKQLSWKTYWPEMGLYHSSDLRDWNPGRKGTLLLLQHVEALHWGEDRGWPDRRPAESSWPGHQGVLHQGERGRWVEGSQVWNNLIIREASLLPLLSNLIWNPGNTSNFMYVHFTSRILANHELSCCIWNKFAIMEKIHHRYTSLLTLISIFLLHICLCLSYWWWWWLPHRSLPSDDAHVAVACWSSPELKKKFLHR